MEKVMSLFTKSLKKFKSLDILQLKNNSTFGGKIKLTEGMV